MRVHLVDQLGRLRGEEVDFVLVADGINALDSQQGRVGLKIVDDKSVHVFGSAVGELLSPLVTARLSSASRASAAGATNRPL